MSRILIPSILILQMLFACSDARFRGGSAKKRKAAPPVTTEVIDEPKTFQKPTTPNKCVDQSLTTPLNSQVVILLDNSSSNSGTLDNADTGTDCPNRVFWKKEAGFNRYICKDKTQRQAAIESSLQFLASHPGTAEVSFAVFPTYEDPKAGSRQVLGLTKVTSELQNNLSTWLLSDEPDARSQGVSFLSAPYGWTPHGAALAEADNVYNAAGAKQEDQVRTVIIVTDGESTDTDPAGVEALAERLKNDHQASIRTIQLVPSQYSNVAAYLAQRRTHHSEQLRIQGYSEDSIRSIVGDPAANLAPLIERISSSTPTYVSNIQTLHKDLVAVINQEINCTP